MAEFQRGKSVGTFARQVKNLRKMKKTDSLLLVRRETLCGGLVVRSKRAEQISLDTNPVAGRFGDDFQSAIAPVRTEAEREFVIDAVHLPPIVLAVKNPFDSPCVFDLPEIVEERVAIENVVGRKDPTTGPLALAGVLEP